MIEQVKSTQSPSGKAFKKHTKAIIEDQGIKKNEAYMIFKM